MNALLRRNSESASSRRPKSPAKNGPTPTTPCSPDTPNSPPPSPDGKPTSSPPPLRPPPWLADVLGPYPDARADRRTWRSAARDLLAAQDRSGERAHGAAVDAHGLGVGRGQHARVRQTTTADSTSAFSSQEIKR
jgi:hypothetical protein